MFFWQRSKKQQTEAPPVPEKYIYYLSRESDANIALLTLSHSGHEWGDTEDFTAVSRDILAQLLAPYWVSAWVGDAERMDYVLPDGQRCQRKMCFSAAFQQYAARTGMTQPFAAKKDRYGDRHIVLFSQGLDLPFFLSYFSDLSEWHGAREIDFYAYKQLFLPSRDFDAEQQRSKTLPWDIHAELDEICDNLRLYIKSPYALEDVTEVVQRVCDQYGKELRVISNDANF